MKRSLIKSGHQTFCHLRSSAVMKGITSLISTNVVMRIATFACHEDFSFYSWSNCQIQCLVEMVVTRNFQQTTTVEHHRPSVQNITKKRLPFYPMVQQVKNCNMMLLCDKCGMWRLICYKKIDYKRKD